MKFTKEELRKIHKICDAIKVKDSVASDILTEIKRTNPAATYHVKNYQMLHPDFPGIKFRHTTMRIDYKDKFNKSFINIIPKSFKIIKSTPNELIAKGPNGNAIQAGFSSKEPIVKIWMREEI